MLLFYNQLHTVTSSAGIIASRMAPTTPTAIINFDRALCTL